MKQPPPVLDVDLLIEHAGHQLKLRGSGTRFAAEFPTLLSLFHFLRISWTSRNQMPKATSFHVEWRGIRIPVKSAR